MPNPKLTEVRSSSLAELAYAQLLEKITTGEFQDGDRIVIDDVAEQLGISRIPVREALARLNAEHLLEYQRNKGYTVIPKVEHEKLYEARFRAKSNPLLWQQSYRSTYQGTEKHQQEDIKAHNRKTVQTVCGFSDPERSIPSYNHQDLR